jgi:hypothetical protein
MQRIAVVLAALIAVSAAAQYREIDLEEINKARQYIPPANEASVAELEREVREDAKKSGIAVAIERVPPVRVTPVIELRALDLSGRGDLHDVQLFLLFVSTTSTTRMTSYESMYLAARPEGDVGFRARLTMACWVEGPLQETEPTVKAIHKLEENDPERAANTIGDLERALRDEAIALTELSVGADTRVSGVLLGTAAREALPKALAASSFRVQHIDYVPRGDCQAFTATMELLRRRLPETPLWVRENIFDDNAASHCTPPRAEPPRRIAAQGGGSVTVHLRNVDAAEVFDALNAATKDGFIVAESVTGRFDVDFDGVTQEAAFAALKTAGITVGPGPLHFVGLPLSVPAGDYKGEQIEVTLHNADLRDVLQFLAGIEKRELSMPPPGTRLSIYVKDEPWDRLAAALQLVKPAPPGPKEPKQRPVRDWWRVDFLNRWNAGDLTLAGVVNTEKGWIAYVRTPGASRKLLQLEPATPLRDARVASIDASGVTLDNGAKLTLR